MMRPDHVPFLQRRVSPVIGFVSLDFLFLMAWLIVGLAGRGDYISFHSAVLAKAAVISVPGYFWALKWFVLIGLMNLALLRLHILYFSGVAPFVASECNGIFIFFFVCLFVVYVTFDILNADLSSKIDQKMGRNGYVECSAHVQKIYRDNFVRNDIFQKYGCPRIVL